MKGGQAVDAIIGSRIREHREAAGLTVQAVADSIGSDRDTLYKWEIGRHRVSAAKLVEIAEAVRCTPAALLAGISDELTADAALIVSFRRLSVAKRREITRRIDQALGAAHAAPE